MLVDFPTLEALTVTFIVTAARTFAEASPTILGGVGVAAWLRTQVTPERMQANFRGDGYEGILRAAVLSVAFPVCSVGVLPVLRELRRMGLPTGKLLTVAIVAPLLNPFSLFYGLGVLSSLQFLMVVIATGLAAITVGDVSSRFSINRQLTAEARPAGLTGKTRLRNLWVASSRLATGQTVIDLLVVIGITTLATSILRNSTFIYFCEVGDRSGPVIASLLTLPQYVSPSRGIIQFAGIGNANLSIATGLAIYVFGTGVSAASILAFSRWYGFRRLSALMLSLWFVIGAGVYFTFMALPAPVGDAAETTALDSMTRPGSPTFFRLAKVLQESLSTLDPLAFLGAGALLILLVTGLMVRIFQWELRSDDVEVASQQNQSRMAKAMPASQLGAVAVTGIGLLFLLSIYIFFPVPGDVMEEIEAIRLDASIAINSGDVDLAIDRLTEWDSAVASVPIASAIRGAFPSPPQRQIIRDLRAELHSTRKLLDEGDLISAGKKLRELVRMQSETKDMFAGSSS